MLQVRGLVDWPRCDQGLAAQQDACAQRQHSKSVMRISLIDGIALHFDGREVALSSRKARALIAYLAFSPGMKETRDCLAGLLWSETENGKARASLRQLLGIVREAFDKEGFVGLSADKVHVSLNASACATDLDCALTSINRGEPADMLVNETRITDRFLRDYDDVDPAFGSWLLIKRESVRQLLIQRLEAQLSMTSHWTEAIKRVARALFQIDPTHEIACRKLMHAYAASGNTARALATYKQLWECMEHEYDVEPSTITQQLAVAIKSGAYGASAKEVDRLSSMKIAARTEEVDPILLLAVELAVARITRHYLAGSQAIEGRQGQLSARRIAAKTPGPGADLRGWHIPFGWLATLVEEVRHDLISRRMEPETLDP